MIPRFGYLTALLLASVVISGCGWNPLGDVQVEELSRQLAPDQKVEAVIELRDGGATSSRAYCVYIVPRGKTPTEAYRVVTFDGPIDAFGGYGLTKTVWSSPSVFEVTCATAKQLIRIKDEIQVGELTYRVDAKTQRPIQSVQTRPTSRPV